MPVHVAEGRALYRLQSGSLVRIDAAASASQPPPTVLAGTPYVSTSNLTSGSVTLPDGTAAGDVTVLAVTTTAAAAVITGPAGWNTAAASFQPSNTVNAATAVFWRAYQAGDPASVTVTVNATSRLVIIPLRLRGLDSTTDPFEVAPATTASGTVTAVPAPSVTASSSRALLTVHALRTTGTTGAPVTWTPPTGMTEVVEAGTVSSGFNNAAITVAMQQLAASGATGTRSATPSEGGQGMGVTLLLRAPSLTVATSGGGGGGGGGGDFDSTVLAISGLTHYYPLDSASGTNDLNGSLHLDNMGGVTFGADGATFTGAADSYLRAPTGSIDFSAAQPSQALAFLICVTFPTYDQGTQEHWMGIGYENGDPTLEWAMRLYGDSSSDRARNISAYYWNPDPSTDINGNPVASNRGSGSYLAPPEGARTPPNGPTGSGSPGVEHLLGIEFTSSGTDAVNGRCRMFYGSSTAQMALISDREMHADAYVTPVYNGGRLHIGRRGESPWTVQANIRRVAFWNRQLSLAEWQSIRDAAVST